MAVTLNGPAGPSIVSSPFTSLAISARPVRRSFSVSAIHCAMRGMPANGNMKPDSRIEGRKMKNVICMAWNCEEAAVEISSPSARLAKISRPAAT